MYSSNTRQYPQETQIWNLRSPPVAYCIFNLLLGTPPMLAEASPQSPSPGQAAEAPSWLRQRRRPPLHWDCTCPDFSHQGLWGGILNGFDSHFLYRPSLLWVHSACYHHRLGDQIFNTWTFGDTIHIQTLAIVKK
jgi:hypothetical protein